MLLSIERVLRLLAEGKSVEKIAELAGSSKEEVCGLIEEARMLLEQSDKLKTRKKVIFKKKASEEDRRQDAGETTEDGASLQEVFDGAELTAVPVSSSLTIYVDGASSGNPGPAGIGIVIIDSSNHQVGKVSAYIGTCTNNVAEYTALIRALEIALYYKTRVLKIRTDSELVEKQMKGEYRVSNENIRELYEKAQSLKKKIGNCKIEHVTRNLNDKADYLAKKAASAGKVAR
jgi:ribonuclease HI